VIRLRGGVPREHAEGTPTQSHLSPSRLVYEEFVFSKEAASTLHSDVWSGAGGVPARGPQGHVHVHQTELLTALRPSKRIADGTPSIKTNC